MLQWIEQLNEREKKATALAMILFAVVFCLFIFKIDGVLAQSIADPSSELQQGLEVVEEPLGLPNTDIRLIIARIIRVALGFIGIIMVVMFIFAGYLWMTAGGNDEQITRAKSILLNAVIGLAIILSSYAIVAFVMRMLGVGGFGDGTRTAVAVVDTQNFRGSGALGRVIQDHYPARGEQDIPRNTKIAVTFSKPVLVSSFSNDTNNNGIFGDCVVPDPAVRPLNIRIDCDAVKIGNDFINISKVIKQGEETVLDPIGGASLVASYVAENNSNRAYVIVIQPYDFLGSDEVETDYLVHLGGQIRLDITGAPMAFDPRSIGNSYYEWQFVTSKELDLNPPHVTDVFPASAAIVPRNTAIQINFDKAIDPIGVQGRFNIGAETYYLDSAGVDVNSRELNSYVYLFSGNSTKPIGKLSLVNNYRTLEFVSETECGVNACGGKIYCLPVCDEPGSDCVQDNYKLLLKAAFSIDAGNNKFQSVPGSGIADMSGNALDGGSGIGAAGRVETAPRVRPIFVNQETPDNFYWNFNVNSVIDLTAPYVRQIEPGLDASDVSPDSPWLVTFSKRMLISSLYSINIAEYPTPAERCSGVPDCEAVPLWHSPFAFGVANTTVREAHGSFLNNIKMYYFPIITSDVLDVNYNCMYPGLGPGRSEQVDRQLDQSLVCDDTGVNRLNCCAVAEAVSNEEYKSFCCNGIPNAASASVADCVDYWTADPPGRSPK